MKPFWVGFQFTLGVIAGCIAIPLLLIAWARAPDVVFRMVASSIAIGVIVAVQAARKAKVPAALAAPEPQMPWERV